MTWNLYEKEEFLEPLCFSNGKTQKDVVKEVLDCVKEGHRVIFIHGVCGTGKSAIALNIARKLGKSSIVVPIKNLQEQYKRDYEGNKYLKKDNGEKLNIKVITGRNNHVCKFLEDMKTSVPVVKKEIDSKLHDIFSGVKRKIDNLKDFTAENPEVPCKIEIREKNLSKLKKFVYQNKDVNPMNFKSISDVRRMSVAGACPYWCPVYSDKFELNSKSFSKAEKLKYDGLEDFKFIYYQRKPGCGFYSQFRDYVEADVLVFNSLKYQFETILNRKPKTEVEIIDECDEFLDNFSNQRNINLDRLQNSLIHLYPENEEIEVFIKKALQNIKDIKRSGEIERALAKDDVLKLTETSIFELFRTFTKYYEYLYGIDEESYVFDVFGIVRLFDEFFDETYLNLAKKENNLIISLVTVNLAKRFQELLNKNKILVLMSGTLHSAEVLQQVFGIKEYKVVNAEIQNQGQINVLKTGLEKDCKYSNFFNGKFDRASYLKSLSKCIEVAKKPVLVHIQAYSDLPTEKEVEEFGINNLLSREKLRELQAKNKRGEDIEMFKAGDIDVLFSTKASRGMDFPGEQCNSIVFTKYPNPNVKDVFWKILAKTNPTQYWNFYKDKARRELWQKVYRGLRFKDDKVYVLSPDLRVIEGFEKK